MGFTLGTLHSHGSRSPRVLPDVSQARLAQLIQAHTKHAVVSTQTTDCPIPGASQEGPPTDKDEVAKGVTIQRVHIACVGGTVLLKLVGAVILLCPPEHDDSAADGRQQPPLHHQAETLSG